MKRGAIIFVCGCFVVLLLAGESWLGFAAGCLLLAAVALRDRPSLMAFRPYKLWIFPVLFVALSPLFIGEQQTAVEGLGVSHGHLRKGMMFLFHVYCFVVFGTFLVRAFSLEETMRIAERVGMENMGLRIALGGAAAKILSLMVRETYGAYRMTRPTFLSAARESPILFGAIIRNSALVAERITILFHVRGIRVGKLEDGKTERRRLPVLPPEKSESKGVR